jgi:hypothetical protein
MEITAAEAEKIIVAVTGELKNPQKRSNLSKPSAPPNNVTAAEKAETFIAENR